MISLQHQTQFYFADKTNIIKIITNNPSQYPFQIGHNEKYIDESGNTKFLGLHTGNYLNWKNHFDQFVPKKIILPILTL